MDAMSTGRAVVADGSHSQRGMFMNYWIPTIKIAAITLLTVCQGVAQTTPSSSATSGNDYSFNVATTQPWTDTGVDLQSGDVLNITASGN